ncbi:alpha-keto acid decarboxylase family protein [Streptomyces huasconensis]|uniref:alpha-keto acid decarboxylase family protein n=1 Tax=Streptomyces huasconensis TaxID=1854574 RepID=UPI0034073762
MKPRSSKPTKTVIDYALDRLHSLGVGHVFGVAGDYNLPVLDHVHAHPEVKWIGTASELGAAYAADGYSRTRGFGALLTTFGVGELSAINGVAGSYAERVPLLHIVVGPTQASEHAGLVAHHTMGDGDFDRFARAHRQVVCADAVLRPSNAVTEIDRILAICLRESRPGYLRVPRDVALSAVPSHEPPALSREWAVDHDNLEAFRRAAGTRLAAADTVVVLADFLVDRFKARAELADLLQAGTVPHAVLVAGKTVVDESASGFLGLYAGAMSTKRVRAAVDKADLLIRAGVLLADMSTGKFTHRFDPDAGIDLGPFSARVDGVTFPNVPLAAALAVLADLIGGPAKTQGRAAPPRKAHSALSATSTPYDAPAHRLGLCRSLRPLTQSYLWEAVGGVIRPDHIVVADNGTSLLGVTDRRFPSGAKFIAQPLWASIGYSLPALLGAQLADPYRRGVLIIGDGAAQMTVQELGTIARHRLKPIVILVNNHGYTIERITHGLRAEYNDISHWRWSKMPSALGVSQPLIMKVRTQAALDRALARATATTHRFVLIEVFTSRFDVPPALKRIALKRPDKARWVA